MHRHCGRSRQLRVTLVFAVAAGGCERSAADTTTVAALPAPAELPVPAAAGSAEPFLHAGPDGAVLLSWIEPLPDSAGHALRLSFLEGAAWTAPRTVAEGDDWFVNWADFPSVHRLADGTLAAHWLQRNGPGTYAYGVRISLSRDGGATWSAPITPHRDSTETEHGFVSLFAAGGGALGAVWLDGRNAAHAPPGPGGHGADADMTLRYTTVSPDGTLGEEMLIDGRTCECCQTDVALASGGPVVVYRDRSPDEIRDIHISSLSGGRWSDPAPVHEDGWRIPGCPVNGPAIAAAGDRIAVAWFTEANDTARVRLAFSADGGDTFAPPIRVDDGDPAGRVDLMLLEDGSALVTWLERGDTASVRVRRVSPAGGLGEATVVATTSAARSSGFPRMVRSGDRVIFAWTEAGTPSRIHVAAATLAPVTSR
jgi:hypothetical protein